MESCDLNAFTFYANALWCSRSVKQVMMRNHVLQSKFDLSDKMLPPLCPSARGSVFKLTYLKVSTGSRNFKVWRGQLERGAAGNEVKIRTPYIWLLWRIEGWLGYTVKWLRVSVFVNVTDKRLRLKIRFMSRDFTLFPSDRATSTWSCTIASRVNNFNNKKKT